LEGGNEVFGGGEESFGNVDEYAVGLEDFGEVGLDSLTIVKDFVAVAGNFEAFSVVVHANYGYVGEADLVYGLAYSVGHICF